MYLPGIDRFKQALLFDGVQALIDLGLGKQWRLFSLDKLNESLALRDIVGHWRLKASVVNKH